MPVYRDHEAGCFASQPEPSQPEPSQPEPEPPVLWSPFTQLREALRDTQLTAPFIVRDAVADAVAPRVIEHLAEPVGDTEPADDVVLCTVCDENVTGWRTTTCADCGETMHCTCIELSFLRGDYCRACAPEPYASCGGCCEAIYDDDNYTYCDDCGEYRCDTCACDCGSRSDDNSTVHGWSYRPHPFNPKGEYPRVPLLGVELEVGSDYESDVVDAVHSVDDCEHHLYMKEDGSITGVEIVSHPATLDWTNEWNKSAGGWLALLRELQCNRSVWVGSGYGLHIHVSRNAFRRVPNKRSTSHTLAWLLFIYRNVDYMKLLARRADDRWCKFQERGLTRLGAPIDNQLRKKAVSHEGFNGDRYVAVNCNNDRTFELRMFQATLDPVEFMGALEFASASVEYTRGVRSEDALKNNALDWSAFSDWVDVHADEYPNLQVELARVDRQMNPGPHESGSRLHVFPRQQFAHEYQRDHHATHRYV